MEPVNERMFKVLEVLKSSGAVRYDIDFCKAANILHPNFVKIRNKEKNFDVKAIYNLCKAYNINANYLFGNDMVMFNPK